MSKEKGFVGIPDDSGMSSTSTWYSDLKSTLTRIRVFLFRLWAGLGSPYEIGIMGEGFVFFSLANSGSK